MNAPHAARNVATFGSPAGPARPGSATGDAHDSLANEAMTPALFASNVVRNLSIHAGTGWRPLDARLEAVVKDAHALVGLDASDPRTSRLFPLPAYVLDGSLADPDRTGNPAHLVFVLVAAASIFATPSLRRRPRIVRYALGLAAAFAAFCLVLKWQPWHSRLHLPWFVLAAPLVGVAAEGWRLRGIAAVAAMGVLALPPLVKNNLGPLLLRSTIFTVPRSRQYFHWFGQPSESRLPQYLAAADVVRGAGCRDVGLLIGWDDWEHTWWVFLSDEGRDSIRVRHVGVANPSARLLDSEPAFAPCAVIVGRRDAEDPLALEGRTYRLAWTGADWKVFASTPASASATVR